MIGYAGECRSGPRSGRRSSGGLSVGYADNFDPERRPAARHLAFGNGAHRCLGARLATMELQEVVGTLVAKAPGLRLADPDGVRWRTGTIVRGPLALPVTWPNGR
jgi:nocardicin N-oxygenase